MLLGRSVVGAIGGGERFGGGSTEIKQDDVVGAGMEPWPGRVQREFRPYIPETSKGARLEKGDSFRNSACIQEGVVLNGLGSALGNTHDEAAEAWTRTGI